MDINNKKATIMVVDDTPANLKLLQDMLHDNNYRVLTFPRGEMALTAAAKNPPDLFLLDINMPEMNGFDVCVFLKKNEKLNNIPVIFLSGRTDVTDKIKAFSIGGVDYITKPFHIEEVRVRIDTHLRMRQMHFELEMHNSHLEELVQEKMIEISESQQATIHAVSKLAESRDYETGQHIERIQLYCKIIAQKMSKHHHYSNIINDTYIENICHSSPLHDIGKVGISDNILLKPEKLTSDEFEIMKTHTLIGANTLQTVRGKYPKNTFINMGIAIARSHHEKWDGSGYPDGQSGEDIPLSARIMAIADVYDALRTKRHYKEAFPHQICYDIILQGRGSHFDPFIVDTFQSVQQDFDDIHVMVK